MTTTITSVTLTDVRYPTSDFLDGSDAVHTDPDYSVVYVRIGTTTTAAAHAHTGHGFTFTLGRGNEVIAACVEALRPLVLGLTLEGIVSDWVAFTRRLTQESQLRWLGPEKGVVHMACGAIINAVWDLWAKSRGKPVWRLVADMSPEEVVALVDFHYIEDVLSRDEALALLRGVRAGRDARIAEMVEKGYPAYTTSAGWLGYSDDKIRGLCKRYIAEGFVAFKMKVGASIDDDLRRAAIIREEIGDGRLLMMDANQRWSVNAAIEHMTRLAVFKPWWIEEPTHPDDVLGHARIAAALEPHGIGVATGEVCANAVMFKQLLQAKAIKFCQIDSCRMAGVNEVLAVLLLAAKFGVAVCPHAGGVGLCEYVRHLAMVDYIVVSGSLENRVCESTSHLHEHFFDPVRVENGRYRAAVAPGYATMRPESIAEFQYPHGTQWTAKRRKIAED